uniref:Solute carrier family 16 member 6 n=1 Tax=Eptatretus burgeri TaxID=7764 RepID=A0A8C4N4G9_EPTBU
MAAAYLKFPPPKEYSKVPDGGWGFVVMVAFFFVEAFTYGVIKSFGVFFEDLMKHFGTNASSISWAVSICVFCMTFAAPLSVFLSTRFTCRHVVMLGGILSSAGTLAASFSTNVVAMYLSLGLVTGLGFSFSLFPCLTSLSMYFDERRSLIMAVASTGECFATLLLAPGLEMLKQHIGWQGAIRVVAAGQLTIVVCGVLIRPILILPKKEPLIIEKKNKDKYIEENEQTLVSVDSGICVHAAEGRFVIDVYKDIVDRDSLENKHVDAQLNDAESLEARALYRTDLSLKPQSKKAEDSEYEVPSNEPNPIEDKMSKSLDLSVLREPSFICYSLFGLFATLGFFSPGMFVVPLAVASGVPSQIATYLLSGMAGAELLGRFAAGLVFNRPAFPRVHLELVCSGCLVLILFAFPIAHMTFTGLMACSILFGLVFGAVASTHIPLLAEDDIIGPLRMASGVGVYVCIQSFSCLIGPPLAGWLVDMSGGNYLMAFYCSGTGLIVASAFLALVRPCKLGLCRDTLCTTYHKPPVAMDRRDVFELTLPVVAHFDKEDAFLYMDTSVM